jgi:hypothetical protein
MVSFEKRGNTDIVTFSVNKINALIADDIRENISKLFDLPHAKVIIDLKGIESRYSAVPETITEHSKLQTLNRLLSFFSKHFTFTLFSKCAPIWKSA